MPLSQFVHVGTVADSSHKEFTQQLSILHLSIYGIYIVPLKGNHSKALPAQARCNRPEYTPAGVYPGILWPRPIYARGIFWPRPIHTPSGHNIPRGINWPRT